MPGNASVRAGLDPVVWASGRAFSRAAAAVTSLKVEPGGRICCVAAVEHRLVLVAGQPLPVVLDGGEVVAGQDVGVVRRLGDHGEDRAGAAGRARRPRPWCPRRALEPAGRGLLGERVEGRLDAAALGLLVGQQVDDAVDEQPVVAAGQDPVLRVLEPAASEDVGEVAGDRRVELRRRCSGAGT